LSLAFWSAIGSACAKFTADNFILFFKLIRQAAVSSPALFRHSQITEKVAK
jgi:hypothetical protein